MEWRFEYTDPVLSPSGEVIHEARVAMLDAPNFTSAQAKANGCLHLGGIVVHEKRYGRQFVRLSGGTMPDIDTLRTAQPKHLPGSLLPERM